MIYIDKKLATMTIEKSCKTVYNVLWFDYLLLVEIIVHLENKKSKKCLIDY